MASKKKGEVTNATAGDPFPDKTELLRVLEKEVVIWKGQTQEYKVKYEQEAGKNEKLQNQIRLSAKEQFEATEYLQKELRKAKSEIDEQKAATHQLQLQLERKDDECEEKVEATRVQFQTMLDELTKKYEANKTELDQIRHYRSNQLSMESKLVEAQQKMEAKEREAQEMLMTAERKYFQQKMDLKDEINRRVEDIVQNFQKVTEEHAMDTTSKVMRDNVNIKLQMARVMQRLSDLTSENQRLVLENRRLKDDNDLATTAHAQLMKKHAADHRLLQLLLAKLQQDDDIFCSLSSKQQQVHSVGGETADAS